jgi:hypothetical protein
MRGRGMTKIMAQEIHLAHQQQRHKRQSPWIGDKKRIRGRSQQEGCKKTKAHKETPSL